MNIAIINDDFSMGGVQKVASELGNALSEHGSIYLVNFFGQSEHYYRVNEKVKKISLDNKINFYQKVKFKINNKVFTIRKKNYAIEKILKKQLNVLLNFIQEYKIEKLILCQGLLATFIPRIKREYPYVKIIAWQHNTFDIYVNKYYVSFKDSYVKGLERADYVVTLTKDDAENFRKYNKSTCCIYNPLTLASEKVSNLTNRIIIFVGRLVMEQKGLDLLLEIFDESNDGLWKLKIIGDGKDKDKFQELISKSKNKDRIELIGLVDSSQLENYYSEASIFVSTSRWEGFGLVITEAMQCGLPIISFNNKGPIEILQNGKSGILIENYDINKYVSELRFLMKDYKKRCDFQAKSIKRAKDFNMNNILKEWLNILN